MSVSGVVCIFGLFIGFTHIEVSQSAAPVWNLATTSFTKAENVAANDLIVDLIATDADNDALTISIISVVNVAFTSVFTIINGNDLVIGSQSPDAELTQGTPITVTVRVTDGSTAVDEVLTITITDLDDVSPTLTLTPSAASILEGTSVTQVAAIAVTDGDFTNFGTVTVAITGGNTAGKFAISGDGAFIETVDNSIDYTTMSSASLQLTATDPGGNTDVQTLTVTIETAPTCNHGTWSFSIGEDAAAADVAIAYAGLTSDEDSLPNAVLTYTIQPGHPTEFELSGSDLVVSASAVLDFESGTTSYTPFVVSVSDGKHTTTCSAATVTITNVNEAPSITSPSTVIVADGASSGTIYTITATDPESDTVTFSITAGNAAADFSLTGAVIAVAATLDRSTTPSYTFTIEATDSALTTPFTLTINVNGAPVITSATPSVNENSPVGTVAHTIAATDPDSDSITLTIDTQDPSNPFQLVGNDLQTTAAFDHETTGSYSVTIKATDGSSLAMSSTESFTITVSDVNEPPTFDITSGTYNILEGGGAEQVVVLTVTDVDDGDTFTYSIAGNPVLFETNSLSATTVEVKTTGSLNYAGQSSYTLTVTATDSGGLTVDSVLTIAVKTVPVISSPTASASFSAPENSAVDTVITTIAAADADGDSLVNTINNVLFGFVGNNLVVKGPLDYETTTQYTPTITVTDTDGNTDTVAITIDVTDENDLSPVFQSTPYTADVLEKGTAAVVGTVQATDGDTSLNNNNVIAYSIQAGNDDGKFSMNSASGQLTATDLRYSDGATRTLTILAADRDGALGGNSVTIPFTISVQTAPYFTTPPQVTGTQHQVPETTAQGAVYTFVATDDDGAGASLTYTVVSILPANCPFEMDGTNNAQINLNSDADLDIAVPPPLVCTVIGKATDADTYTATASIELLLTTENDNPPVFNPDTKNLNIDETHGVGTSVSFLAATDADLDSQHNSVTYTITGGNGAGKFVMSSSVSNQVDLAAALNDQTAAVYTLTITASDGLNTDTATLTVNVAVSPVVTTPSGNQNVFLPEDSVATDTVFTVAATDLNTGEALTYSIGSQPTTGQFAMSGADIVVGTGQTFDYEAVNTPIPVTVTVTDAAGHAVTSPTLSIIVTDVNDVNPSFQSATYTLDLKDASPIGKSVIQLAATDGDGNAPNNQIASYAITAGNTNSDFTISNSGLLTVAKVLDRATTSSYSLTVQATDSGTSPLQGTTTVDITVIQDTDPVISDPVNGATVDLTFNEDKAVGDTIYTLVATDADGDTLLYTFKSGNTAGKFQLVGNLVKLAAALDYEEATSYTLDFYVDDDDSDTSNKQTSGTLSITVSNVNDFPVFENARYNATAMGGITEEQFVTQVKATDQDTSQTLTYMIVDGDPRNSFQVNNTGHLFTMNYGLNWVQRQRYVLAIQAIDNGSPSLRDSTHVYIDVLPINSPAGNQETSIMIMLLTIGLCFFLV